MYNLSENLIKLGKKYDFEPIATGGNIDYLNYWQHPTRHFVLGSAEDVGWGNVTLEEPVVLCCYQKAMRIGLMQKYINMKMLKRQ